MRIAVVLLTMILAVPALAQEPAAKGGTSDAKMSSSSKQLRWQGHLLRINKDSSTIVVRGGMKNNDDFERQIAYDDSTQWTKLGKPADQSEFKDGSFVIVTGHSDDKKMMHATRVDLRTPR